MQHEEEKFIVSTLDTQLNRLVFPESECPTYHLCLVIPDGNVSKYTWTPKAGMETGLKGDPTVIIELRVDRLLKVLPQLLDNEYNAERLVMDGVVRLGGLGRDIIALGSVWGT